MVNIRQKINQLRVAYFTPTRPDNTGDNTSSGTSFSLTPGCFQGLYIYGSCTFYTPVVPFCGLIATIVTDEHKIQTSSVQLMDSPFRPLPATFCIPRSVCHDSVLHGIRDGRLYMLDFSNLFRQGYRNTFHQYGTPYLNHTPNFKCTLNLYF